METLHEEMRRLVREQPELSCAQLMVQLRQLGWQIESPTGQAQELLASTPAWVSLLSIPKTAAAQPASEPMPAQLLDSGCYGLVDDAITAADSAVLRQFCDQHFHQPGLPPVALLQLEEPLRTHALDLAVAMGGQALRQFVSEGHPLSDQPFVLLMNRCLLRRTYPPQSWSEALRNNNNQHWHQDSNPMFGVRPMLTLWVPLQQGAGSCCPGLETSSVPADFFSIRSGDSTPDHDAVCVEHGVDEATVTLLTVPLGQAAGFNGLTYHRTALREGMDSHRDALLLRVCPQTEARWFPGDRSDDVLLP